MADSDSRRKRALYRAHHRGTKEMDLILGGFADAELAAFNPEEVAAFEMLLALPDPEIDRMLKVAEPPPDLSSLIRRIRRHCGLEVVRKG
jgi:antitoxin CptB